MWCVQREEAVMGSSESKVTHPVRNSREEACQDIAPVECVDRNSLVGAGVTNNPSLGVDKSSTSQAEDQKKINKDVQKQTQGKLTADLSKSADLDKDLVV